MGNNELTEEEFAAQKKNLASNKKLAHDMLVLNSQHLVLGLTGRTGSGCSTTADILCQSSKQTAKEKANSKRNELLSIAKECDLNLVDSEDSPEDEKYKHIQNLKQNVISHFLSQSKNRPVFRLIKIREIILLYAIASESQINIQESFQIVEDSPELTTINNDFKSHHEVAINALNFIQEGTLPSKEVEIIKISDLINTAIPSLSHRIKENTSSERSVSAKLQEWANLIRKHGEIVINRDSEKNTKPDENKDTTKTHTNDKKKLSDLIPQKSLAAAALWIIEFQKKFNPKGSNNFVIDSLRNPFEVLYLRNNIPNFFLVSVNMDSELRYQRLLKKGYSQEEIEAIDTIKKEKAESKFHNSYTGIDIDKCLELCDIFIDFNLRPENDFFSYYSQIERFSALLVHPGLIPPTDEERVMQVALAAKLNSGCISRQVGAAVTNKDFSVLSIGWNIVPGGQTPCSLRSIGSLIELHYNKKSKRSHSEDFSKYELSDNRFKKAVNQLWNAYENNLTKSDISKHCANGVCLSYCFKDVYNSSQANKTKRSNQVHTRSIHAEENAFLQLAKYGSVGIENGYLFTTASCCVLCAKKAYQLGIRRIYYVDAYPDISENHILKSGNQNNQPEVRLFRGAIGRAYLKLYTAIIPLKDEIQYLTSVDPEHECVIQESRRVDSVEEQNKF